MNDMPDPFTDFWGYFTYGDGTNMVMTIFFALCLLTIIFGILGSVFGGRVRRGANGDPVGSGNLGWFEWLTGFFRKR